MTHHAGPHASRHVQSQAYAMAPARKVGPNHVRGQAVPPLPYPLLVKAPGVPYTPGATLARHLRALSLK
jgi:hypothetical protein